MNSNEEIITLFYTAFQNKDHETMARLYHPEATFKDGAFDLKSGKEARTMWKYLITSSKDLRITFQDVKANGQQGSARWDAWYTFQKTGNKVHNIIYSSLEFKDGLIYRHHDQFNFWRWSRQALGWMGWLLGWSPFLQNRVRSMAMNRLKEFEKKSEDFS